MVTPELICSRRRRSSTSARAGGAGEPLLLACTNSVLYLKHLLSDLWRVFDFQSRWQWTDQERTKGKGNATLSTESDNLVIKVKSYNVKTGFLKKVSETLELVDILAAKVKFFKYACAPIHELLPCVYTHS